MVNEPRGNDAIVGALLCEPSDPTCDAGVIFFNNVGYLNMCGHGTIGLVVTLAHMGRIRRGTCRLDTVVDTVEARLNANGSVTIRNVASYRSAAHVAVEAPGIGRVHGDIAWGGNWFFLCSDHGQELSLDRLDELTDFAWRIRQGIEAQGIAGGDGRGSTTSNSSGRPRRPARIARASCCARVRHTTARRAARAPAPNWPACTPMANCSRARSGGRKASWAACSRAPFDR